MNGIPMRFDYSKSINEQLPTFEYYKNRYCAYELQISNLIQQINSIAAKLDMFEEWLVNLDEDEFSCDDQSHALYTMHLAIENKFKEIRK